MKLATIIRALAKPEEDQKPKGEFDLLSELQQYLISSECQNQRSTGSFNPSGLDDDQCRRALAFNYLRAPVNDVPTEPRLQITFLLGHHIHERFQEMFERMARLKNWEFDPEVKIKRWLNKWYVSGRCDGVFLLNDGSREGIEIKSMNKNDFNRLYDAPLYKHQYQGNIYLGLLHCPRMHYIYVCKDNSQLKFFSVPFDRSLFEIQMKKIERIMLRLQSGKLPKRVTPACTDRKCKFREVCWSDKTVFELANNETRKELRKWRASLLSANG